MTNKQHDFSSNGDENPFGNGQRSKTLNHLLEKGLVRRITLIEGNYPTKKEQQSFIDRIIEWVQGNGKKH